MKDIIITPDASIKVALEKLNKSGKKCLLVVDENTTLIGTLTDGDLRKAILKGSDVTGSIEYLYNLTPTFLLAGNYDTRQVKRLFLKNKFDLIPIVDRDKRVVDFITWEKVFESETNEPKKIINIPVVIMAGGKGTRLEPFTKVLPKPLLPINEKPIIELIIEQFTAVGSRDFYLTVNYKSRILRAYFEEMQPDYSVHFIEEAFPLGTAGSLKFLEGKLSGPFFVTNCDVIIKDDYVNLYDHHCGHGYDITLVASMKEYVIPYGTCELTDEGHLSRIREKPEFNFLINTGLYVLSPQVLKLIPDNRVYNITELIDKVKTEGMKVGVYPISDEAWIDVGQWAEYKSAIEKLSK